MLIDTPAQKIAALRRVILTLADGAHHERITALLDALEQDIGHTTFRYAARIARVHAEDDHHDPATAAALTRLSKSIARTEWDRRRVVETNDAD